MIAATACLVKNALPALTPNMLDFKLLVEGSLSSAFSSRLLLCLIYRLCDSSVRSRLRLCRSKGPPSFAWAWYSSIQSIWLFHNIKDMILSNFDKGDGWTSRLRCLKSERAVVYAGADKSEIIYCFPYYLIYEWTGNAFTQCLSIVDGAIKGTGDVKDECYSTLYPLYGTFTPTEVIPFFRCSFSRSSSQRKTLCLN